MKRKVAALCVALGVSFAVLGQDPARYVTEKLGSGYRFTEGPAWSQGGFLIFSDTPANQLLKWIPGRQPEVFRANANGPSGNAFDEAGRLYTGETRARRVTRTDKNGKIEVLAEKWEGKRLNAPAGIAVSKSGHVYFTDPAFGYQLDQRELDFYGVYHIPPRGPMKLVARPKGRPHGVALSPNGRILYVANADEHNIRAYDLDRGGDPSNERVLVSRINGVPGGMTVDEKGNLWVAANGIAEYSPEGRLVHTMAMTDRVSSCAFGEADMNGLFVTSGSNVYRIRPAEQ